MTPAQACDHVCTAEELWIERSRRVWELDLRMLTNAGVTLARPERAADRLAAAVRPGSRAGPSLTSDPRAACCYRRATAVAANTCTTGAASTTSTAPTSR